jgi:hypothetical protein
MYTFTLTPQEYASLTVQLRVRASQCQASADASLSERTREYHSTEAATLRAVVAKLEAR